MVCGERDVEILKRCRKGLSVVSGIECDKEGCKDVGGSYLGLVRREKRMLGCVNLPDTHQVNIVALYRNTCAIKSISKSK
jgi:hypothetical protein